MTQIKRVAVALQQSYFCVVSQVRHESSEGTNGVMIFVCRTGDTPP